MGSLDRRPKHKICDDSWRKICNALTADSYRNFGVRLKFLANITMIVISTIADIANFNLASWRTSVTIYCVSIVTWQDKLFAVAAYLWAVLARNTKANLALSAWSVALTIETVRRARCTLIVIKLVSRCWTSCTCIALFHAVLIALANVIDQYLIVAADYWEWSDGWCNFSRRSYITSLSVKIVNFVWTTGLA